MLLFHTLRLLILSKFVMQNCKSLADDGILTQSVKLGALSSGFGQICSIFQILF